MPSGQEDLMYRLENVIFHIKARCVLDSISFNIKKGEKVVILGVNGAGKTTLLRIMDGLIFPSAGKVIFENRELTEKSLKDKEFKRYFRSKVSLMFQDVDAMFFNPTVYDDIAFSLRQRKVPEGEVRERVAQLTEVLSIGDILDRAPYDLSGGEKKKVAFACCVIHNPDVLLLDEPTAFLDPDSVAVIVEFLQDYPGTVITATHNLSIALELGERFLILSKEHKLVFDGSIKSVSECVDVLREAGLVHRHRHRHGGLLHEHLHLHDWD